MNKIDCGICLDLIPLVKDGVASEESVNAVLEHIETCPSCRSVFDEGAPVPDPMDEKKIVGNIKREFFMLSMMIIFVGTLIGLGLSESSGMFLNILIMPAIGALGYAAMPKKSFLVPVGMFGAVYVWHFIKYLPGMFRAEDAYILPDLLAIPIFWSCIYALFCAVGTLIAFLLHFAFKKGDRQ